MCDPILVSVYHANLYISQKIFMVDDFCISCREGVGLFFFFPPLKKTTFSAYVKVEITGIYLKMVTAMFLKRFNKTFAGIQGK